MHGFACITHRGNQIVSGLALNILASGLTITLGIAWFERGGQTPTLGADQRFQPIRLPFAETLQDVPLFGAVYGELLSGHKLLVYLAFIAVPLAALLLARTRFGLRLRAVGESPEAVDSAGVSVPWLRYRAVILAGVLCGIAGAYLSTAHGAGFIREMSAGKGYIALAAMIFGKWRPWPALFACLLFGFLEAASLAPAGRGATGDRAGADRPDADPALRHDGGAAGRLLRTGGGAGRTRHALREGALTRRRRPNRRLSRLTRPRPEGI